MFQKDEELLISLMNKFAVFNKPQSYYEDLIAFYAPRETDKKELKKKIVGAILKTIQKEWQQKEIGWLINYLNKNTPQIKMRKTGVVFLSKILGILEKNNLEIDMFFLREILKSCPEFESLLYEVLGRQIVTESYIYKLTGDEPVANFLYMYATLKDLIKEEKESTTKYDEGTYLDSDIVREYLKEIGNIKLYTPEEEQAAFLKLEQAKEENNEEKYDRIKQEIAERNLRLVVSVAKRYVNRGLDFLDLIQEGNLGLLKGIDKYDVHSGYKLSTYATSWIRQSITRAIADKGATIRIPVHAHEIQKKLKPAMESFEAENNRQATPGELAEILDCDENLISTLLNYIGNTVSLDFCVGEEEDTPLASFIAQELFEEPEETALQDDTKTSLNDVLSRIPQREEFVLRMRFGVNNPNNPNKYFEQKHTLEEVGAVLCVTRERVRQIEAKALKRIKNTPHLRRILLTDERSNISIQTNQQNSSKNSAVRIISDEKIKIDEKKPESTTVKQGYTSPANRNLPPAPKTVKKAAAEPQDLNKNKTLKEILNCTDTDLDYLCNELSKRSKKVEMIFLVHGQDLKKPYVPSLLNDTQKRFYGQGLEMCRKKLMKKSSQSFIEIYSIDEADLELVRYLIEKKNYDIIYRIFGKDFEKPYLPQEFSPKDIDQLKLSIQKLLKDLRDLKKRCKNSLVNLLKKDTLFRPEDIDFLMMFFGPDFDVPIRKMTAKDMIRYDAIIEMFSDKEKPIKFLYKTIKEALELSDEELEIARYILQEEKKESLKAAFGENLDQPYKETKENSKHSILLSLIILRDKIKIYRQLDKRNILSITDYPIDYLEQLKRMLKQDAFIMSLLNEDLSNVPVFKSVEEKKKYFTYILQMHPRYNTKNSTKYGKYLWEILGCKKEDLERLKDILEEDSLKILTWMHGTNFDHPYIPIGSPKTDRLCYSDTLKYCKKYLTAKKLEAHQSEKTLWEQLGTTSDALDLLLYVVKKYGYKMLFKAHGNDLTEAYKVNTLRVNQNAAYQKRVDSLKEKLRELKEQSQKNPKELLGIDEESFIDIKVCLEEKDIDFLKKFFGENLDTPSTVEMTASEILRYCMLLDFMRRPRKKRKKTLENATCSAKVLEYILNQIGEDTVLYTKIMKYYAIGAKRPIVFNRKDDKKEYNEVVMILKDMIKALNKTLQQELNATSEEMNFIIEYAKKQAITPQQTLYDMLRSAYGDNLDQVLDVEAIENIPLFQIKLDLLRKVLIENSLRFVQHAVNLLPDEYRQPQALYLGIFDGIKRTKEELAEIFATDVLYITTNLEKGRLLLEKIMNTVGEIYFEEKMEVPQLERKKVGEINETNEPS